MGVFPLFVDLTDKRCVVIGGGNIASRKIEILLRFNPVIDVVSPDVNSFIQELVNRNKIKLIKREYNSEDILDAFLIIAATSDERVNERIYQDAIKRRILINVVDDPDKCTFIFPSIVKRGDLVIGISTSGKYPALSKGIRRKLQRIIPQDYSQALEILGEFRTKVYREIKCPERQREILNEVVTDFLELDENTSIMALKEILQRRFKS